MAAEGFEEIEHTADWALRVTGADLGDLLRNAAEGMLSLSGAKAANSAPQRHEFDITAPDRETLLVSWLEEILYEMETRRVTFDHFELEIEGEYRLHGQAQEYPLDRILKFIKAVTFSDLEIEDAPEGLRTQVVFDV
jgi:SHS2 domain-containing protein